MKYFYDTEFLEGPQRKTFLGIPFGETAPTIDLISIGVVAEDGREYYAIHKNFNLKEAWNRYDLKTNKAFPSGPEHIKEFWIRENVLLPIYKEFLIKEHAEKLFIKEDSSEFNSLKNSVYSGEIRLFNFNFKHCFNNFKNLLNKHGRTKEQIRKELFEFVNPDLGWPTPAYSSKDIKEGGIYFEHFEKHNVEGIDGLYVAKPEFYGYYADYDHVALSWIFGKMIDLPAGFPMYTKDLKQMLDDSPNVVKPKQTNAHNALADAKWNFDLYKNL